MARAKSKTDLIDQAEVNFSKLWQVIDDLPEQALTTEFDFSDEPSKKEAHWKRDKNLRDILTHLYEWHQLLLEWVRANKAGEQKDFIPKPYNWKTYGDLNVVFWKKHQTTSLNEAKAMLKDSHKAALNLVSSFSDEELFTKAFFNWTGSTSLGSYCISAMPSHYDWAIKKLRAHLKKIQKR